MTSDAYWPQAACPRCGREQDDPDGFGVLHCEACGWCKHPCIEHDRCTICGKVFHDEATR